MKFSFPDSAAAKSNERHALHLPPVPLAVSLLESTAVSDSASDHDRFNLAYFPQYIEVHRQARSGEFPSSNL